jgi:hypothetical protein
MVTMVEVWSLSGHWGESTDGEESSPEHSLGWASLISGRRDALRICILDASSDELLQVAHMVELDPARLAGQANVRGADQSGSGKPH